MPVFLIISLLFFIKSLERNQELYFNIDLQNDYRQITDEIVLCSYTEYEIEQIVYRAIF